MNLSPKTSSTTLNKKHTLLISSRTASFTSELKHQGRCRSRGAPKKKKKKKNKKELLTRLGGAHARPVLYQSRRSKRRCRGVELALPR